jgi:hypothetical protein
MEKIHLIEEKLILHYFNVLDPRYLGQFEKERIRIEKDRKKWKYMGTLKNITGIIPVHGSVADFGMDFHDALIPIAPNLTAVERCVLEMAIAGVSSIWIVCNKDIEPLIRTRIGDYLNVGFSNTTQLIDVEQESNVGRLFGKRIQIYYLPVKYTDFGVYDGLIWSILHGAMTSYWVFRRISRWTTPEKFYVAFPHGVYNPRSILQLREKLHSSKKNLFLMHKGANVVNNKLLGFCFNQYDLNRIMWNFKTLIREQGTTADPIKKKIIWKSAASRKNVDFQKTFRVISNSEEVSEYIDVPWFYEIDSWEKYSKYMGSKEAKEMYGFSKTYPLALPLSERSIKRLQFCWDKERNGRDKLWEEAQRKMPIRS